VVYHPLEPHPSSIFGRKDLGNAVTLYLSDLIGNDHPAAAAEYADMLRTPLHQLIADVLEKLHVPPLVAADRNTLGVLLDGRGNDLIHRAIMTQVYNLCAGRLENAADDIGRGVMAVKKTGGCDEADLVS